MLERNEFDAVYACVCDLNGAMRGKRIPSAQIEKIGRGEIRMPLSILCLDIWGEDVEGSEPVFETGDADGLCDLIDRKVSISTWTSRPSAFAQLWMREENGKPFLGDPRRALAEILSRYKAHGLTPVVATELEFYLYDDSESAPSAPRAPRSGRSSETAGALSLDELQKYEEFLDDVYDACALQDIPADAAISENGAGQFEINLKHSSDALKAADDAVLFKRLVKGVARRHGMGATFMAKPYGDRSGSGLHVHYSLIDEQGRNVFDDGGARGTDTMLHAVSGMLSTMQDHTLIFAPHENSYRRLLPGSHAPSAVAWGYGTRTAAIRIPGGDNKSRRIEHRVAGSDANPYLVIASILGGALLGIESKAMPPQPIEGDAYSKRLQNLPLDWASAIEAFSDSTGVERVYSKLLKRMLTQCKMQELRRFTQHVTDFEYQSYLETA